MCVQNKWDAAFSLFSYFCNTKKTGSYFLVYSTTSLIRKISVQSKRGAAAFKFIKLSFISYFCNTKNISAKQAGDCFLSLLSYVCMENVYSKKAGDCFLVY